MNNGDLALSLKTLAYRDYIAARVLLNKGYPLQGLTLASSSIEKYFKVILAIKGIKKRVHMDRLDELKKLLTDNYADITTHLDNRFLELLGKTYQARYYDNLTTPLMIGFFINQVRCELDFTVAFLEKIVTFNNVKSAYNRAIENKDADLLLNNYLALKVPKKDFMEQPDQGFGVYIDSINGYKELELEGTNVINPYNGTIWDITLKFK